MDFRRPCDRPGSAAGRAGFSLLELLMVVGIILVLFGMVTVGFNSILQSSRMEQAGRIVVDEINLARQTAMTKNRSVEIRFLREVRRDGTRAEPVFWRMQVGVRGRTEDAEFEPLKGATQLPQGVALAPEGALSSLLAGGGGPVSLVIRPTGVLESRSDLSLKDQWFVTLVPERGLGKSLGDLTDFATVQIDPVTARPSLFRP